MRFLFVITVAIVLSGQAYACERGDLRCGDVKPTTSGVNPAPAGTIGGAGAQNPSPNAGGVTCRLVGSVSCLSPGGQGGGGGSEGSQQSQQKVEVETETASLAPPEESATHNFTLPVQFTFQSYEQCLSDISAKAPMGGGIVQLPQGVSTDVFCRRLYPQGVSQTQVNSLQVTFTSSSADQCESNLTSGLAQAHGAVGFGAGETPSTYCEGLFGENTSGDREPAAAVEIENSKL